MRARLPAAAVLLLTLVVSLVAGCTEAGRGPGPPPRDELSPVPRAGPPVRVALDREPPVLRRAVLGVKPDWYEAEELADYFGELGGGRSWAPVVWCGIESPTGDRDWSGLDEVVRRAGSLRVGVQLKIRAGACELTRRGPSLHEGYVTESQMPEDLAAYRAFVRALVERYSPLGVHSYAVENEPNTPYQWGGSVAQLVRLSEIAATVIRRADDRAQIADWGLSTGVYGDAVAHRFLLAGKDAAAVAAYNAYERTALTPDPPVTSADALRSALGSGQDQRNLAYLDADERLLAQGVFDVRQLHFYQSTEVLPGVIAYLRATTPDRVPIEAWELGRHDAGGAFDLRAEVARSVSLLLAAGIGEVTWLPLTAPVSGVEPNLALLEADGATRPAGAVYRLLARLAARTSSFRPVRSPGVSGLVMSGKRRTSLVIWSTEPSGRLLRLPAGSRARPLAGVGTLTGRTLTLGPDPVLVRVAGRPAGVRLVIR